ncbi:MAG: hypothetical protein ACFE9V_18775 [Candidatus Hodarchaeota archaeon]
MVKEITKNEFIERVYNVFEMLECLIWIKQKRNKDFVRLWNRISELDLTIKELKIMELINKGSD